MRILLLAPHPFFQVRGTPLAVDLVLRTLSEQGHDIHVLTYNEGADRAYKNLKIFRINPWPAIQGVKPGFSFKKLYLDFFFFFRFLHLLLTNKYYVVHAVEESAFMAFLLCPFFRTKFIFDMDSSLATQVMDRYGALKKIGGLLRFLESLPIRFADAVLPVCDALGKYAREYRSGGVFVIKDVSLIEGAQTSSPEPVQIRSVYGKKEFLMMYIGNMEPYQGIDLFLESFSQLSLKGFASTAVLIGGDVVDIAKYKKKSNELDISDKVIFLGKQDVTLLQAYMKQADLLISSRIKGENTPMKVYSYMDSGTPVLATDLPTHRQVMTEETAFLAAPNPEAFCEAMIEILQSPKKRIEKAREAKEFIKREHSHEVFREKLLSLYNFIEEIP